MKINLPLSLIFCFFPVNANSLSNGLYYSKWVYDELGVRKTYQVMANKYDKDDKGVYLLPGDSLNIGDEIYLKISNNKGSVFYRQVSNDGGAVTVGRGAMDVTPTSFVVRENISTTFFSGDISSDKFYINHNFPGKNTSPSKNEIIPFKQEGYDSFSVDCRGYLKINGYDENGIPDYEEGGIAYNATIFASESGLCSLFLDDNVVRQIKKGRILFEKVQ